VKSLMYSIRVNREKCKGCGNCAKVCPENWRLFEDKKAHPIRVKVEKLGCNKEAMESCPYNAISIVQKVR